MVISRICGKARLGWHFLHSRADSVDFCANGKIQARSSRSQTTNQTNESRLEERDASTNPKVDRPVCDQVLPEKWQYNEVSPNYQLHVVPVPRPCFHIAGEKEDRGGWDQERETGRQIENRVRVIFPKAPRAKHNQEKNQREGDPKVHAPKFEEWPGEIRVRLNPAGFPF